jgi:hypothetical protein
MSDALSRVFTVEVDGRPTLAFEASRKKEAQEICKESWLRGDLILSSGGIPDGWQAARMHAVRNKSARPDLSPGSVAELRRVLGSPVRSACPLAERPARPNTPRRRQLYQEASRVRAR